MSRRTLGWSLVIVLVGLALLWHFERERSAPPAAAPVLGEQVPEELVPTSTPEPPASPDVLPPEAPAPVPTLEPGAEVPVPESTAPERAWPEGAEDVVLTGRVRNARGEPVAGVDVTWWTALREMPVVQTDAQGRYRLPVGPRTERLYEYGRVYATDGVSLAGEVRQTLWVAMPAVLRMRDVHLLPAYGCQLEVRREGLGVAGARVVVSHHASHTWAAVFEVESGADGRVELPLLPKGTYRVTASQAADARGHASITLPPDAARLVPIDLVATTRALEVIVVQAGTGEPVADAQVECFEVLGPRRSRMRTRLEPQPVIARTNAEGRTWIAGLDPDIAVALVARVEGGPPVVGSTMTRHGGAMLMPPEPVPPGVRSWRIEVPQRETIRWKVVAGELPVPADGTTYRIVMQDETGEPEKPQTGRIEDGVITADAYAKLGFQARAILEDGSHARLWIRPGSTEGEPVSFMRPGVVEVHVRDPDGNPVPGCRMQIGELGDGRPVLFAADANGVARAEDVPRWRHRVYLLGRGQGHAVQGVTPVLGEIDLRGNAEARLEATVALERDVRIRLLYEGQPHVPPGLVLNMGGHLLSDFEVDPATAEIGLRLRGSKGAMTQYVRVSAPGFASANAKFDLTADADPLVVDVALERRYEMYARVSPPKDGRYQVQLHRWVASVKQWSYGGDPWNQGMGGQQATVLHFGGLQAGRYRLVDTLSGVSGLTFDLAPADSGTEQALDLSRVIEVHGRIEVPDGHRPRQVLVLVEGRPKRMRRFGGGGPQPQVEYGRDGDFTLRMAAGAREVLLATHKSLTPETAGGRIVVSATGPTPIVKFVRGAQVRLRFHPDTLPTGLHRRSPKANIQLFKGKPGSQPVLKRELAVVDGAIEFGGYEPGTYTLWIDAPPFAPTVIEGVVLGADAQDLGEVRLEEGLAIVAQLSFGTDQVRPPISLSAWSRSPPTFFRTILVRKPGDQVVLRGLLPGNYLVRVSDSAKPSTLHEQRVRIRGDEPVMLKVDASSH